MFSFVHDEKIIESTYFIERRAKENIFWRQQSLMQNKKLEKKCNIMCIGICVST